MRNKIVTFAVLLSLLVSIALPSSDSITAMADEVYEWTNFAEYCYYNGIDMDKLPVEYDETKSYMLVQWGTNGTSKPVYLFVWDSSAKPNLYQTKSSYTWAKFVPNTFNAVYVMQYQNEWYDNTGWSGISTDTATVYSISGATAQPMYSDENFYNGDTVAYHVTKTGQYVQFREAVLNLTDEQKTKLSSYDYYVVATRPIVLNSWQSEQIVIACSNSNKAIFRPTYKSCITYTTGTGWEQGYSLIYDSFTEKWVVYESNFGYIGGTASKEPNVMYTNVDIYYEVGDTFAQDTEVWCTAVPYGSVTPTPMPNKQELVTSGFPRLYEVVETIGAVYESPSDESRLVAVQAKGKGGLVHGYEYDENGNAWYKVGFMISNEGYEGYILADSVHVGFSAPSGGSSETPVPTVVPPIKSGQANVINDRTGVYEEPTTSSQLQHYLYSGALVYVVEVLENDWYYVRYEVGGLSQTGYVYASNIDYDSENGVAPDVVGGDVVENVEEMLNMVKVVPVMISVLFSFLPPWCLAVVGVGFSLLIVLIIYKCARG